MIGIPSPRCTREPGAAWPESEAAGNPGPRHNPLALARMGPCGRSLRQPWWPGGAPVKMFSVSHNLVQFKDAYSTATECQALDARVQGWKSHRPTLSELPADWGGTLITESGNGRDKG